MLKQAQRDEMSDNRRKIIYIWQCTNGSWITGNFTRHYSFSVSKSLVLLHAFSHGCYCLYV